MNKAFTKEDEDAGFDPPPPGPRNLPVGPFRVTASGARRLAEHADPLVRATLDRAEIVAAPARPDRAALGVVVVARVDGGEPRRFRLVGSEEHALLGDGVSVASPIGRALVGTRVGDVVEVALPRGAEELEVTALEPG
jgi:transcription elongation GreA/GreB family factor